MSGASNPYDEVPYDSYPFAQSHPNRLATIATLFGLRPSALERCRVLEIGCAAGGNLLPLAASLSGASFTGIDLSQRQIADGQRLIASVGLTNVRLGARDLLTVDASLGRFDYIICHGVYSWVGAAERAKILAICAELLEPQGVAYVSYNTYPGWAMRGVLRQLLLDATKRCGTAKQRVDQARVVLDFLARSIEGQPNAYATLLKNEAEALRGRSDSYLLHEYLQAVNEAVYFADFIAQASSHGLQYLAETDLQPPPTTASGFDVNAIAGRLANDLIEWEQYQDILRNRPFRQTLLCHASAALDRNNVASRLVPLFVASPLQPDGAVNVQSAAAAKFTGPAGTLSTAAPLLKAALTQLGAQWPQAMPVEQLVDDVTRQVVPQLHEADTRERHAQSLLAALLDCYTRNCVQLYVAPPRCTAQVDDRPRADALARVQAAAGSNVTNLLHGVVILNQMQRQIVILADGTHDQPAIVDALAALVARGELSVQADGVALQDPARIKPVLAEAVRWNLGLLAREAMLLA